MIEPLENNTLFFYYEKDVLGRWGPRTSSQQPRHKGAEGQRYTLSQAVELPKCLHTFPLMHLDAIYGRFINPDLLPSVHPGVNHE